MRTVVAGVAVWLVVLGLAVVAGLQGAQPAVQWPAAEVVGRVMPPDRWGERPPLDEARP